MHEKKCEIRKKNLIIVHINSKLFKIPKNRFMLLLFCTKRNVKYEKKMYNISNMAENCLHFDILLNWKNSLKNIFDKIINQNISAAIEINTHRTVVVKLIVD